MLTVAVFAGSIVDAAVGAHAIINSSNPSVGLGSGVSGAIAEACGRLAFQQEIRQQLEDEFNGSLEPGDCLVTGPGGCSAFRWVLHVPSVDYRHRDPETQLSTGPTRVRKCFSSALEEAALLAKVHGLVGTFMLATPLLGAGHGGLGAVRALDAMMAALRSFLRDSSREERDAISRVVFVVLAQEEARLVRLAAERHGVPFGPS